MSFSCHVNSKYLKEQFDEESKVVEVGTDKDDANKDVSDEDEEDSLMEE